MTADMLTFPTEAQAADYFRTHGDEWGRPYRVVGFGAVAAADQWPPRSALGWNAAGEWVWEDEHEGQWP
jgi:hypothetical protein